jgi:hypothetical protein
MSRAVKKKVSSISYSFNKLYRKISTAKPSTLILSAIVIAIIVFFFGGGLYDLIIKPYSAPYSGGTFILVDPRLSEQFLSDSIVSMILFTFGAIGLLVIYQSTKYAYKPRQAYMMFLVGAVLLLLAYVSLEVILHYKLSS